MKKLFLIIAVLVMALSITACTVDPSDDGSDVKMIKVEVSIDYPDADDEEFAVDGVVPEFPADIEDYRMKVESGATVMQILESFASQNGLEILVEKSGDSVYVTSINGVAAGENTGWVYEVEDKNVNVPASQFVPEHGDEIIWEFIRF